MEILYKKFLSSPEYNKYNIGTFQVLNIHISTFFFY